MGIVSAMMQVGAAIKHAVAALFKVTHSLRLEYSESDYLTKTLGTPTTSNVWTWSGWVKLNSYTYNNYLFSAGNNTTDEGYIYIHGATKEVRVASRDSGTLNVQRYTQALTQDPGEWIHIVVQGSSNSAEVWINGQQQTSWNTNTTNSTSWSINSAVNHGIGVRVGQSGSGPYLDGQLAEIHFIDGQALTAADFGETNASGQWVPREVTGGFSYGTNGFYLPFDRREEGVTLLLDGSSTSLTTDASSAGNDPTNTDVTSISTTITGRSSASDVFSFSGSNQYLTLPSNFDGELGTGEFTIECWLNATNTNGTKAIFDCRVGSGNTSGWVLYLNGTSLIHSENSGFNLTATSAVTASKWHHVALVRSSNTTTLFVDGSSVGTVDVTGKSYDFANPLAIGQVSYSLSSVGDFAGNIADLRITKGIARDVAAGFSSGTPITNGGWDVSLTNDIQFGSLGRDATTNSNDFTVNGGITPDDQLIDSPNLRFATLDPTAVSQAGLTISEANLQVSNSATNWRGIRSDFSIPTNSKAYYEWVNPTGGDITMVGVTTTVPSSTSWYPGADTNSWGGFEFSPATNTQFEYYHNGTPINFQQSGYTIPDYAVAMVAVDRVNGKIHFGIDGLWWTSTSTRGAFNGFTPSTDWSNLPTTGALYPALGAFVHSGISFAGVVNFGQDHTFAGAKSPLLSPYSDDDGNGEFYYQPPSGFKALATSY